MFKKSFDIFHLWLRLLLDYDGLYEGTAALVCSREAKILSLWKNVLITGSFRGRERRRYDRLIFACINWLGEVALFYCTIAILAGYRTACCRKPNLL